MKRAAVAVGGLAIAFGPLQGWAQPAMPSSGPMAPPAAASAAPAAAPPPLATGAPRAATPSTATATAGDAYTLGPGDKIRVIVYGEAALSGEFLVSGSGKVSFPLIGDVQAANLTVQAFQQELETGLRQGYLKEPRVSVEVLTYRPYYILGEVNKPGEYPYASGLTVLNAVATAGGFTYRAQTKKVFIRRNKETTEKAYPLSNDVLVTPGDTIRIAERLF